MCVWQYIEEAFSVAIGAVEGNGENEGESD